MRRHSLLPVAAVFSFCLGSFFAPGKVAVAQEDALAFIPPGAVTVLTVKPQKLLEHPMVEMMPVEIAEVWTDENLGLNLRSIEQVRVVVNVPIPNNPGTPVVGAVVKLSEAYDPTKIAPQYLLEPQPRDLSGRKVWVLGTQQQPIALCPIDETTVVLADRTMFRLMLGAPEGRGPLVDLMKANPMQEGAAVQMITSLDPVRPMFEPIVESQRGKLPPPLEGLVDLPKQLTGLVLDAHIEGQSIQLDANFLTKSPEDAAKAKVTIDNALAFARQMVLAQVVQNITGEGRMEDAQRTYVTRLINRSFDMLTVEPRGDRLFMPIGSDVNMASTGVVVGLLLPAVQAAREAARRTQASNNLRQIGLAMHNYAQDNGHLPPPAIYDDNGEPLLSWRVLLLPYLEQQELYAQFHLDEPWNSEHNGPLVQKMPAVFADPSYPIPNGYTVFHTPVGEDYGFSDEEERGFRNITDGTSNTIMVFEAGSGHMVAWTDPEAIDFEDGELRDHFGNIHSGGFNALFFDGSVRFIAKAIDPEMLAALLTIDGGELVQLP